MCVREREKERMNTLQMKMEIFIERSTQCSGVKCVTPSGGPWGEGETCNGTPVTYGASSRWVCLF